MLKFLVPLIFLTAQFLIAWYGYHTGKLPAKGAFLGFEYDSLFVSTLIVQLKFVWLLIIINFLFSLGFHWGFSSYRNFVVIAMIWIASGPVAALIFNMIIAKEPVDLALVIGIVLIAIGGVLVVAHKEFSALLS